jgi:hypothetical protein
MRYWFNDMGLIDEGKTVEVTLTDAANIRIMDENNFKLFKKGEPHDFVGGYVKFTPYRIKLPRQAHWYVVADKGGQEGEVNAAVLVYPNDKNIPKVKATVFA